MGTSTGGGSDTPRHWGEPEGAQGLWAEGEASSPGPPFTTGPPSWGPTPGLTTTFHPGESQGLQGGGCSHCLFASLGKSRTSGPCHTHQKRRGGKSTSAEAHSSRTQGGRGGPTATAQGHLRRPLPLPPRRRAASGSRLRPEVGPAPALGTRREALGEGPRWGLTDHSPQVRVCEHAHKRAGGRVRLHHGDVCAHPGVGCPQEGNPSPLPVRGGQAHVGRGSERGLLLRKPPAPGCVRPAAA